MTLDELNSAVASEMGTTKAAAAKSVQAVMSSIQDALAKGGKGGKVSITGFGIFEVSHRPAREGRNPQTGKTIQIAASNTVKFKVGKALREAVNG